MSHECQQPLHLVRGQSRVGLPLFLGSVAVMAFTVHFAVLSHTTWFSDYWQGSRKKTAKLETAPAQLANAGTTAAGFNVSVTPGRGQQRRGYLVRRDGRAEGWRGAANDRLGGTASGWRCQTEVTLSRR